MIPFKSKDNKAVAAAGNYTAKDAISESATVGTAWTFTGVPGAGRINKALLKVKTGAQVQRCTLFLYKDTPTCVLNDNVASTGPLYADKDNFVGQIDFPALEDLSGASGGMSLSQATPSTYGGLPLEFNAPKRILYGVLITRDAFTNEAAADNYEITLEGEAD